MRKGRKRTRRLIALGLGLMMLISNGIVAQAMLMPRAFEFELRAGGDRKRSAPATKVIYSSSASISISECANTSQHPLWYRVRAEKDDTYATDVKQLYGTGSFLLNYINGHGVCGELYYIRMQTDSQSEVGATVKGSWRP